MKISINRPNECKVSNSTIAIDALLMVIVMFVAFSCYKHFAILLAHTSYSDYINLAFDFDPAYFVHYLTAQQPLDGMEVNFKHPLWMIYRPIAWAFLQFGYTPKESAGLTMAFLGACTVGSVYLFGRINRAGRIETFAATAFFAASSTTFMVSIVPESYGFVNLSLVLLWTIYSYFPYRTGLVSKVLIGALVIGNTITNLMQFAISEFAQRFRQSKLATATFTTGLLIIGSGLIILVIVALCQPHDLWKVISDPVATLKAIYWQQTKGPTVGLIALLKTYFVYSFFAPEFTSVQLSQAVSMLDFREFNFPAWQLSIIGTWLLLLSGSVYWILKSNANKTLALGIIIAIVINLVFHMRYQFRGSVYIYAAHLHFLIFAIGLVAAASISKLSWKWRISYVLIYGVFFCVAVKISTDRANELIRHINTAVIPADAPEISAGTRGRH